VKIKIAILFITLTLTACFESQLEKNQELHIKESEDKLKSVMVNYSQHGKSINNVEEILKHHQTALDEFNQIKKHFSKYKDENRLQTIISLYDYAFTHFILKQVQIIELASPIWNRDISTLEKIKDYSYFQQHQQFLSELMSIIDENKKLILNHHENVRKRLVSSSLENSDRKRLWPLFNDLTAKYISALNPLIHPIQTRIESEIEISSFFYKNKDGYVVTKENGLEFNSFEMLDSYNHKLKMMNKKYNAARVISRLVKP
jgi:hypothetical protein